MSVADVLAALDPFGSSFTAILGVLIAGFMVRSVLYWFSDAFTGERRD